MAHLQKSTLVASALRAGAEVDLIDANTACAENGLKPSGQQVSPLRLCWSAPRGQIQENVVGWLIRDGDPAIASLARSLFDESVFSNGTYCLAFTLALTAYEEGSVPDVGHIAMRLSLRDKTLSEDEAHEFLRYWTLGAPRPGNANRLRAWLTQAAADLRAASVSDKQCQVDKMLKEQGIAALADVTDLLREPQTAVGRFPLIPFDKIVPNAACNYVVDGLIPRGLTVVWGPPKCGKSFWTLDLALHIASGWAYRSRRVVQGPVVYIALEGSSGYGNRVEAFRRQHSPPTPDFYLVHVPLDLAADHEELIAAIRATLGAISPVCVVIDTVNRSLGGSESSDEDMGAYVKAVDAVQDAFKCSVMAIYHCGIDKNRPRGHTSLTGAADAQLAVTRDGDIVQVKIEWMKDGLEGDVLASRLKTVEIGMDNDSKLITSCVIEPVGDVEAAKTTSRRKLSDRQQNGLDALIALLSRQGEALPAAFGLPSTINAARLTAWKDELISRSGLGDSNPRKEFTRLQESLRSKNLICIRDDYVWLVSRKDEPSV